MMREPEGERYAVRFFPHPGPLPEGEGEKKGGYRGGDYAEL